MGVISQRLVRVLCPHCKQPHVPTESELNLLAITRESIQTGRIFKAVGCNNCNGKGYVGRTIIQELLLVSEPIRSLIMQRRDGGTIKKQAVAEGMRSFRDHGIEKIMQGITTIEEVLANTQIDL